MKEIALIPKKLSRLTSNQLAGYLKQRLPQIVAIADKMVQAGWLIDFTTGGLAFDPPASVNDDPENLGRQLTMLGIKEDFTEASRSISDIREAESEFSDRCVYDQLDLNMRDPHHQASDCCGVKMVTKMTELEEKYGRKSLVLFNDYDRGVLHGRLEALRWLRGEEWEEPVERHSKAKIEHLIEIAEEINPLQQLCSDQDDQDEDDDEKRSI